MEWDGFFKQNARLIRSVLQLTDILLILLGFLLAYFLRFGDFQISLPKLVVVLITMSLVHLIFSISGVYQGWRGRSIIVELSSVLFGLATVLVLLTLLAFFTKTGSEVSRSWIALSFGASFGLISLSRIVIRSIANYGRIRGWNYRRVLIVGAGDLGGRIVKTLELQPWAGIKVVGFFDDNKFLKGSRVNGVPVLGACDDVTKVIETYRQKNMTIDHVWIALPSRSLQRAEKLIDALQDSATSISVIPDFFELRPVTVSIDNVASIPLINLSIQPIAGINRVLKKGVDLALALVFLLVTAPFLALIALLIKIDSSGPVFFFQRRYGLDGKEFLVCKFRTMSVQENGFQVVQAKKGDARVTRIGKLLRKTSIDEIPQFFNVLQGSMSIVGPRPHAVAHNELYRKKIKGYMTRHTIKPGITGLAQVSGCRGETETESKMQKRIEYDLSYIKQWSLLLDFKIMCKTAFQLIFPRNVY